MDKDKLKVKCEECGKLFLRITNTHLWKEHNMSMDEYIKKYPKKPIEHYLLMIEKQKNRLGKTYEEIHGYEKAQEIKKIRSENTKKQMKDPKQIQIRKECPGHTWTEKEKIEHSKKMITNGNSTYRQKALDYYGEECMRCGSLKNIIVHHKNFKCEIDDKENNKIENLMVLCKKCHSKLHNESKKGKFVGLPLVEKGMILMLKGLKEEYGLDINNENFKDTPKRVSRMYAEIFEGINCEDELHNIAETSFPSGYKGMIIGEDIKVFSMCPHHFLPVEYIVNVGYIPDKKTIGISKLSRVVDLLSKAPELQEIFTKKIADILQKELKPLGVIVQVKGKHFCMTMRGIKQINSWTSTSEIRGVFKEPETRAEFSMLIKK